ncbi:MAG: FliH/SctL family protein [Acidobacteriota bacterium]|nr:FliH/SctL family protein [Acidobacteriota bacterium]
MPRGRVIDAPAGRPYRPPERAPRASGVAATGDGVESREPVSLQDRIDDAVKTGYEEGHRKGLAEAEQLIAQNEDLVRSLSELHSLAHRAFELVKDEVIGLALKIASRIVREKIDAADPIAARAAEELLERVGDGVRCRVRVHPSDQKALLERCPPLSQPGLVELIADPSVGRGGLLVETEEEELDARPGTAYQALWEAVTEKR